jgi:hypothetical protein
MEVVDEIIDRAVAMLFERRSHRASAVCAHIIEITELLNGMLAKDSSVPNRRSPSLKVWRGDPKQLILPGTESSLRETEIAVPGGFPEYVLPTPNHSQLHASKLVDVVFSKLNSRRRIQTDEERKLLERIGGLPDGILLESGRRELSPMRPKPPLKKPSDPMRLKKI